MTKNLPSRDLASRMIAPSMGGGLPSMAVALDTGASTVCVNFDIMSMPLGRRTEAALAFKRAVDDWLVQVKAGERRAN